LADHIGTCHRQFFFKSATGTRARRTKSVNSIIGKVKISENQASKLGLSKNNRLSPMLEKCCLGAVAKVSFEDAEKDIKMTTGMAVSGSSQQRLVQRYKFKETEAKSPVEALSVDGGKVRIRTPKGQPSQWRDYKAVSLHGQGCAGFFRQNEELLDWVNRQPLTEILTCLGDGHDGVWNLIERIGFKRREILDWYHLVENMNKIGGSNKRLNRIEESLWKGEKERVLDVLEGFKKKQAINFTKYVYKHRERIPNYELYQSQGICIGSGSVESKIKQIGARMKIVGAQWKAENIPQYLKLRCAYLNGDIA
jgi:hypothetical protein